MPAERKPPTVRAASRSRSVKIGSLSSGIGSPRARVRLARNSASRSARSAICSNVKRSPGGASARSRGSSARRPSAHASRISSTDAPSSSSCSSRRRRASRASPSSPSSSPSAAKSVAIGGERYELVAVTAFLSRADPLARDHLAGRLLDHAQLFRKREERFRVRVLVATPPQLVPVDLLAHHARHLERGRVIEVVLLESEQLRGHHVVDGHHAERHPAHLDVVAAFHDLVVDLETCRVVDEVHLHVALANLLQPLLRSRLLLHPRRL